MFGSKKVARGWTALARQLRRAACPLLLGLFGCPAAGAVPTTYDFVVAQDGSGNFTTVQAAVDSIPDNRTETTTIFVKAGTYVGRVVVPATKWNVELVGESADTTILSWDDYGGNPDSTGFVENIDSTASAFIGGKNFTARNLTFANSHGAGSQATALTAAGNRGRFFDCRFLGYQDTIQLLGHKEYFKRCYIEGATDFIYGSSTAVFTRCTLSSVDGGYITAADTPATSVYGLVFRSCTLTGVAPAASVFLGRSWGTARAVFIGCELGAHIIPVGWQDDAGVGDADGAVICAEYGSTGPGAQPDARVAWSLQFTDDEAAAYTLKKIFGIQTIGALNLPMEARLPWYNEGL